MEGRWGWGRCNGQEIERGGPARTGGLSRGAGAACRREEGVRGPQQGTGSEGQSEAGKGWQGNGNTQGLGNAHELRVGEGPGAGHGGRWHGGWTGGEGYAGS